MYCVCEVEAHSLERHVRSMKSACGCEELGKSLTVGIAGVSL